MKNKINKRRMNKMKKKNNIMKKVMKKNLNKQIIKCWMKWKYKKEMRK